MLKSCVRNGLIGVVSVAGIVGSAMAGGPFPPGPGPWGPDITLCQLYGLGQWGRTGTYPSGIVGLSIATTSWNIGTVPAQWIDEGGNPNHPFIALNLYRQKTFSINGVQVRRFEQIGQSWCKHGFFALSNTQCGPHPYLGGNCRTTDGNTLGIGCTDTYSAFLNQNTDDLGPRYEINPWSAAWSFAGSVFQVGGGPTGSIGRKLQVREADLVAPGGETYALFFEGYYVAADDVDVMNSAGWKPVTSYVNNFNGSNGSSVTWTFNQSSSGTDENSGWGVDAWTPAGPQVISEGSTMFAQQFPIVEKWSANNAPRPGNPAPGPESPDGRGIISWQVTNLGNGQWQYEYNILNIDISRQIGEFKIPVPDNVNVSNIGWSGAWHHNEPENGPLSDPASITLDNEAWVFERTRDEVNWATDAYSTSVASNPLRWGTLHSFWFTADRPPEAVVSSVGLFKPGTPSSLSVGIVAPSAPPPPPFCNGDADGDRDRDFGDITAILKTFGAVYTPGSAGRGDANNDGAVGFGDITETLNTFGLPCP